jgi:hypothetical protein
MFDAYLVPEKTLITAKGDSVPLEISGARNRTLLLLLTITSVVEQESLDVSIWGSADGADWGTKPIANFPQKFYRGEHPMLVDLAAHSAVKFLRAHWEVNRWGRGPETPMFEFTLRASEVEPELLRDSVRQS